MYSIYKDIKSKVQNQPAWSNQVSIRTEIALKECCDNYVKKRYGTSLLFEFPRNFPACWGKFMCLVYVYKKDLIFTIHLQPS